MKSELRIFWIAMFTWATVVWELQICLISQWAGIKQIVGWEIRSINIAMWVLTRTKFVFCLQDWQSSKQERYLRTSLLCDWTRGEVLFPEIKIFTSLQQKQNIAGDIGYKGGAGIYPWNDRNQLKVIHFFCSSSLSCSEAGGLFHFGTHIAVLVFCHCGYCHLCAWIRQVSWEVTYKPPHPCWLVSIEVLVFG